MDFDPRDDDSRDDERVSPRDFYEIRQRDDDARSIGRGPGNSRDSDSEDRYDPRDDALWPDRDRNSLERSLDVREPFTRDLDLPRGSERELVRDRDREYTLRGSETWTLATVGAFRVVSSRDLRDNHDRPLAPRSGDLRHLREQGLVETVRLLADGVDIRVVQLILGHSYIKTTQRYLNITDEELRKALTGVWERRRLLNEVRKPDSVREEDAAAPAVGE